MRLKVPKSESKIQTLSIYAARFIDQKSCASKVVTDLNESSAKLTADEIEKYFSKTEAIIVPHYSPKQVLHFQNLISHRKIEQSS